MIKLLSRQAQTKFKLLSMMLFISRFKQKKKKKRNLKRVMTSQNNVTDALNKIMTSHDIITTIQNDVVDIFKHMTDMN